MGTRNLTVVVKDGEYKVAQYGQWDGYISGAGFSILEYLRNWDRAKFEENLKKVVFLKDEVTIEALFNSPKKMLVHRDTGCKILQVIEECDFETIELCNGIGFAEDSLFCEYAYVVDLDANRLEVYTGFQKQEHDCGRFASMRSPENEENRRDGYFPIKLLLSYSLDELPTNEQIQLDAKNAEGEE